MPITLEPGRVVAHRLAAFTGHKQGVYALEVLPDGRLLSAGVDGLVAAWDVAQPDAPGKAVALLGGAIYAMAWQQPNLLAVAESRQGIRWLQFADGGATEQGVLPLGAGAIFCLASSPHGVLVCLEDGRILLIDAATNTIRTQAKYSSKACRAVVILNDGLAAVGYSDGHIRLLALPGLQEVSAWAAHVPSVFTLAALPDGTLLSGGRDARLRRWQPEDGRLLQDVPAHHFTINQIALSADGALAATASADKTVKIWRTDDLTLLKVLDAQRLGGHRASVNCVRFLDAPNGRYRLATGGDDRLVAVWEVW